MPDTIPVSLTALSVPLREAAQGPLQSLDHHLQPWIAKACGIAPEDVLSYVLERRSLDARRKPDLHYIYQVQALIRDGAVVVERPGITVQTPQASTETALHHLPLREDLPREPIIVGTGPAGLMAAYLLAMHGCKPIIVDRGRDADTRTNDLATFHRSRQLDPDSNYLYGEGGAGTYSDGKLYTRVKDRRMRFLLEAFVAARAPRHILYRHHPHVGSDLLPHMCKRLRAQIEAWGGRFCWNTTVKDVVEEAGRCVGVRLTNGSIMRSPLTLIAPGHSARELILTLAGRVTHRAKGFQLGCRIEHGQDLIDVGQLGCRPGVDLPRHLIGAAEYNLVSRPPANRAASVTTFCMCPGGEIIAATSETGQLSTNGMSRFARSSPFANAGLIVNQEVDRDSDGRAGFALVDQLEQACFRAGGGDYTCPAQRAVDFMRGKASAALPASSYALGTRPGRLDTLLPPATTRALGEALRFFERVIPGFLTHGTLVGVEARISSPIRFERDPATLASSLPGLYLAGEGAGYAGGIVSAALDGLRLAETILTGIPASRGKIPAGEDWAPSEPGG